MATRSMGPVTCQPWCSDGDGHGNQWCIEDQGCWSTDHVVVASLEDPALDSNGLYSCEVQVNLRQDISTPEQPRDRPYVYLTMTHPTLSVDAGVALTPAEATQLRDSLTAVLGMLNDVGCEPETKRPVHSVGMHPGCRVG